MLRIGKSIKVSEKDYDKKTHDPLKPGGYAFDPENWTLTMKGTDGSEIVLSQTALTLIHGQIGNMIEVSGRAYVK